MLQTEVPAECLSTCKPGFAFVCGTDSATYMSECHLKKLACRSNIDVAVQHRGVCRPRLVPNVIPRKGGYTPDTTNSPGDSSDCGRCSDLGYRPVCGTDSLTYYSACILYEYSCKLNDNTLRIKHQGQCPTDTTWNCQRRCRRFGGKEVCGTDGRTYASECHLKRRSCNRENLNLTIAYRGRCIKPSVQDACQRKCFHRYEPVCGSDGVTYLNSCFLEAARCRNSVIELVSEGICQDTVSWVVLKIRCYLMRQILTFVVLKVYVWNRSPCTWKFRSSGSGNVVQLRSISEGQVLNYCTNQIPRYQSCDTLSTYIGVLHHIS